MTSPTTIPSTRAALTATAARSSRGFAALLAGATALGISSVHAVNDDWLGTTSSEWNEPTNWGLGHIPASPTGLPEPNDVEDAVINVTSNTGPFYPILTTTPPSIPRDLVVGDGAGNNGRLDIRSGTLAPHGWMFVARGASGGTINIADPAGSGPAGATTLLPAGSGSLNTSGRFYIGAWQGPGGTGVVNVNTSGTLSVGAELQVGGGGSSGTLNIDAGTVSSGNWTEVGNGSTGTLNMSGGSLAKGGDGQIAIGTNGGNGTGNQSGGVITSNNEFYLGQNTGTGIYNLTGGEIRSTGNTIVGRDGGKGTMNHSGGTVDPVNGEFWVGQNGNSVGIYNLSGSGVVNVNNWVAIGRAGGNGTLNMSGGTFTKTGGGNFIIADNSTGLLDQSGGTINVNGEVWLGQGGAGTGTYTLSNGALNLNSWFAVGREGGTGTFTQTGGTVTKTGGGGTSLGNFDNSHCTVAISGGLFDAQTGDFFVGEGGNGSTSTVTLSGTGEIRSNNVRSGTGGSVQAVLNLDGGTLRTGFLAGAGSGSSTVHFNGTQIVAPANAEDFLGGFDVADVKAGGLKIQTNATTIGVSQSLADGGGNGGVVKTGTGTLNLNGFNSYTGATLVNEGTLGGTGILTGAITVAAGADLNPGVSTGVLAADSVSFSGPATLTIDVNDRAPVGVDRLNVTGNLNLTNASLQINGELRSKVYIIASYGTRTGSFTPAPTLPSGYSINYSYNGNQIALVRAANAFDAFIEAAFPDNDDDPAFLSPAADPDGDGTANSLEFALGGNPASGSDGPKVYPLLADSSDAGTARELLLTIAVLSGTPAFSGTPSPSATSAGFTYTVQGSFDLASFTSPVTPVSPVTTGLPAAPAGYEYRTFSLNGTDGLTPSRGFLRVQVTP